MSITNYRIIPSVVNGDITLYKNGIQIELDVPNLTQCVMEFMVDNIYIREKMRQLTLDKDKSLAENIQLKSDILKEHTQLEQHREVINNIRSEKDMLKKKVKELIDENEKLKQRIHELDDKIKLQDDKIKSQDNIIEKLRLESLQTNIVCAFQDINSHYKLEIHSNRTETNKLRRFRKMLRNKQSHYFYVDNTDPSISDDDNTILYKSKYLYDKTQEFDDKTLKHIKTNVGTIVYETIINKLKNLDYTGIKIEDVDQDTISEVESRFSMI